MLHPCPGSVLAKSIVLPEACLRPCKICFSNCWIKNVWPLDRWLCITLVDLDCETDCEADLVGLPLKIKLDLNQSRATLWNTKQRKVRGEETPQRRRWLSITRKVDGPLLAASSSCLSISRDLSSIYLTRSTFLMPRVSLSCLLFSAALKMKTKILESESNKSWAAWVFSASQNSPINPTLSWLQRKKFQATAWSRDKEIESSKSVARMSHWNS